MNILVTSRNQLDSPQLGIELASAIHWLYPKDFKLERIKDLLVNESVFEALQAGTDPRRIAQDWRQRTQQFEELRQKYLLYK